MRPNDVTESRYREVSLQLSRYDSVSSFLAQNDVFLGVLGFVFDAGTLQQIVALVISTVGTGVFTFISTASGYGG